MSLDSLEQAIELIRQKRMGEAQKLLEALLTAEPHNLPAWFWYVETISTDAKRFKTLELCLKYNPDNEQVKQALESFRSRLPQRVSPPNPQVNVAQPSQGATPNYWQIMRRPVLTAVSIGSVAAFISLYLTELQLYYDISGTGHSALFYIGWLTIPLVLVAHPLVTGMVYALLYGRKEKGS